MTAAGYAIDTSSVMGIEACADPVGAWARLDALDGANRLCTVRFVFDELQRNDQDCYERLHQHYRTIVVPDTELWALVGQVALRHPAMAKPFASRDKADAWIVALAMDRGSDRCF